VSAKVPPAPFIVANPGSGTTLLRMMLDANSELAIPPETHFVPELIERAREIRRGAGRKPTGEELAAVIAGHRRWDDFGLDRDQLAKRMSGVRGEAGARGALRAFYSLYAERQGKSRWGDKTPGYLLSMARIARTLPEARFVHLVRDGRDVALSRRRWRRRAGAPERTIADWAAQWARWIKVARRQSRRLDHYLEVSYEELVADTEQVLREVCEFADLDFEPDMLAYHERSSERLRELDRSLPAEGAKGAREAGHRQAKHALTSAPPQAAKVEGWRTEMDEADRAEFERVAGATLAQLGYPTES